MSPAVKPAIVLVHGSWHQPSHYSTLIQQLQNVGFEVSCPLLPTCDAIAKLTANMYSDVEEVRKQVTSLLEKSRSVMMLLHSYGGIVGTEAVNGLSARERAAEGLSGGVVRLIYMCGYMLQVGECCGGASLPRPDPEPIESDEATGTKFPCEDPIHLLYADVEPQRAKEMKALLVRQSGSAITGAITYPAWQHIPTSYLRTLDDQVLLLEWQDRQIRAVGDAGVKLSVQSLQSSHSSFLSKPGRL